MIIDTRLRLRAIEQSDLPQFVKWLNDPEVIEHLLMVTPLSMAQEEQWFENLLKKPAEECPLGIEIPDERGWLLIGNLAFMNLDWRNRQAEVGIFIGNKQYWGRGFGRDALRLMLRHGFNHLNLNRIYLRVNETNLRGIKSYENAGFVLEGRLRESCFQNGRYINMLIMSVLRSEWRDVEV